MNISVVIPTYNESDNIKSTIQELFMILNKISDINKVEIIIVDDHSTDNTFAVIKEINDLRVKCLRLSRRCGSHTAIRAGLRKAKGDIILCISADGQDDPVCIADMIDKWRSGARVVWALRRNRKEEPWHIRKPAQSFYKLLMRLGGIKESDIDIPRASFCLLDKIVVDAINRLQERNTSLFGLIAWLGFDQDFVEYHRRQRRHGSSKWSLRARFRLALDWIVAFSGLPLRLISIFGIIVAFCGFIYAVYIIINATKGKPIEGWSSIMVAIFILGGFQMVMLGIIGEYLWRNIEESRGRPLYFIEKDTSK